MASPSPRCIVFLGPTLGHAEASLHFQAEYRPPAALGDVYRAAREQPLAIGLVDGVFHGVPAVWHKEVLWALGQGVHVFGASSMGAQRAAELQTFGVVGVGRVFEDYRDGVIESDDEVALVHGPAELAWLPMSVPLVDMRATLRAAQDAGVLDAATAAQLLACARSLFYPDRAWPRLLADGAAAGLDKGPLDALHSWLPAGQVPQKRLDALAMLQHMKQRCDAALPRFDARFKLQESVYWAALKDELDATLPALAAADDELLARLDANPHAGAAARGAALGWLMAASAARAQGLEPDALTLLAASREFCRRHGLADEAAVQNWLAAQQLAPEDLHRMLVHDALARLLVVSQPRRFERVLVDYLRWSGMLPQLPEATAP